MQGSSQFASCEQSQPCLLIGNPSAKQLVVEEELSKNIMVFILPEEGNVDLGQKIAEVFQYLDEKPRIKA